MDHPDPDKEIDFIRSIVTRTSQRVDAQAYHVVHWGLIVLIWYPLQNWFAHQQNVTAVVGLGIGAIVLGVLLSIFRGMRAARRLPAENTFISRQLALVTVWCIGGGCVLSAVLPATLLQGREQNMTIVWGLVYANLAFTMGIVTSRDFLVSGVAILVAAILAMFLADYSGYILGPAMGLGMIIPGLRAEARVRQLLRDPAQHGGGVPA